MIEVTATPVAERSVTIALTESEARMLTGIVGCLSGSDIRRALEGGYTTNPARNTAEASALAYALYDKLDDAGFGYVNTKDSI